MITNSSQFDSQKKLKISVKVCFKNLRSDITKEQYIKKIKSDIKKIDDTLNSEKFQKIVPGFPKDFLPKILSNIDLLQVGETEAYYKKNKNKAEIAYDPFNAAPFLLDENSKPCAVNDQYFKPIEKIYGLRLPDSTLFHEAVHAYGALKDFKKFYKRKNTSPSYENMTDAEEERTIKIVNHYHEANDYIQRTAHADGMNKLLRLNATQTPDIEKMASKELSCHDLFAYNFKDQYLPTTDETRDCQKIKIELDNYLPKLPKTQIAFNMALPEFEKTLPLFSSLVLLSLLAGLRINRFARNRNRT